MILNWMNEMKKEEAIKKFREIRSFIKADNSLFPITVLGEAIDMAIEALSVELNCKECQRHNNTTFFMDNEDEPSVSTDRPNGEWVVSDNGKYQTCSNCGLEMFHSGWSYCPNCGARMENTK